MTAQDTNTVKSASGSNDLSLIKIYNAPTEADTALCGQGYTITSVHIRKSQEDEFKAYIV